MAGRHEVTSTDYPYLLVRVEVRGANEEARALIDTGYTGSLIIPDTWQGLGLPETEENATAATSPEPATGVREQGVPAAMDNIFGRSKSGTTFLL